MADREFVEYEAADGGSTVKAHVVTEETAGEVFTRVGTQNVSAGDVIVATERPEVFDVMSADQWNNTGYADTAGSAFDAGSDDNSEDDDSE